MSCRLLLTRVKKWWFSHSVNDASPNHAVSKVNTLHISEPVELYSVTTNIMHFGTCPATLINSMLAALLHLFYNAQYIGLLPLQTQFCSFHFEATFLCTQKRRALKKQCPPFQTLNNWRINQKRKHTNKHIDQLFHPNHHQQRGTYFPWPGLHSKQSGAIFKFAKNSILYTLSHPKNDRDVTERDKWYTVHTAWCILYASIPVFPFELVWKHTKMWAR